MKETEITEAIKTRLGISQLNEMQTTMTERAHESGDMILLAPTGTGKTIAFLIPLLKALKKPDGRLQALIIAPSRELVQQIDEITREIATGYKVTCCYGGHNVQDEKQSLSVTPSIIVSTPGRLLDHINRGNIDVYSTRLLVLDEFDKTLELGFQDEMKKILHRTPNIARRFLTSATRIDEMPDFVRLYNPIEIDFLAQSSDVKNRMTVHQVKSLDNDKLPALFSLLCNIGSGRTIVFANYREAVERICNFLRDNDVPAGMYHGGMEQIEREKAVTMLNNGSLAVLVTTDLASRGLDITEVKNIIHYHLPTTPEAYTHRNGRTARVNATGEIFVITSPIDKLPSYITFDDEKVLNPDAAMKITTDFASLYFQAGKKEKISKGDIVGFIAKNGGISGSEIGPIDLHDHYAIVAVPAQKAADVLHKLIPLKIKNKRIRIAMAKDVK